MRQTNGVCVVAKAAIWRIAISWIMKQDSERLQKYYETTQKEFLVVVRAVLPLCSIVAGSPYNIRTNYQWSRWILDLIKSAYRLARWQLHILEFDVDVQHRHEQKHLIANTLSCLSPNQSKNYYIDDDKAVYAFADTNAVGSPSTGKEVETLTLKTFFSARKEDTDCCLLDENVNVPGN